jgi:hypothetical protein
VTDNINQKKLDECATSTFYDLTKFAIYRVIPAGTEKNTIKEQEAIQRMVQGYLTAINAILIAHPNIYNELIEDPLLIDLRKFCRNN